MVSGYSDVDATEMPADYVRRLDETGAQPFWQAIKQRMAALLDIHAGNHVLDVGCGTGDDVCALATIVGPTGRVAGLDESDVLIAEARRRAGVAGVAGAFFAGDAHRLPFEDACFHACRAERVLQHVEDPRMVLSEMVRAAVAGGRIVVAEPDYGAAVITGADRALTRKIVQSRCDHFRQGTIGRHLPALFRELQLVDVSVTIVTATTRDVAHADEHRVLHKHLEAAQNAGIVSEAEGTAWLRDLAAAGMEDRYRRALPLFLVSGRKR